MRWLTVRLDIKLLKAAALGAVSVKEQNGKYILCRFTDSELASTENPNRYYSSGVKLVCRTDASAVKMKFTVKNTAVRTYFALDVYCNGTFSGSITNCNDTSGNFAEKAYSLGDFAGEFSLPDGEKTLEIVLPNSVKCEIEYIELENASFCNPVKKQKTLLAYGDSITQGYDSLHPVHTYAMRLADALDAELVNKGLGGAIFCPELVSAGSGVCPDIITVAYGTNDWGSQDAETIRGNIKNFFRELAGMYPDVPVFALSPIWRSDKDAVKNAGALSDVLQMMKEECAPYKNVKVIDGFSLVPGDSLLFGDAWVHPNDEGFKHYADNLYKEIIKNI